MTVSLKTVVKMMEILERVAENGKVVGAPIDDFVVRDAHDVLREARAPSITAFEAVQRWRIRDKTAHDWFWSLTGGWVQEGTEYDAFVSKPEGAKLPPDGEWEKFKPTTAQ